ncbi:MAG: DUF2304 domain-containing protein [Nitrospinae bacterium]|nr:DUF2304 domain-containing protein [Nitrospinota bacterium]
MTVTLQSVAFIFSLLFLAAIFELVRRRRLKESYALSWFFVGGCVLVLSLLGERLEVVARLFGFAQLSNAILVFTVFLLLVLLLGLSVAVSTLSGMVQTMAQDIGLLRNRREAKDKDGADAP